MRLSVIQLEVGDEPKQARLTRAAALIEKARGEFPAVASRVLRT